MVTVHRPFGDRKVIESFVRSTSGHHSALFYDLVRLSEKAGLSLKEEQKDILDTISTFNLQARYDDYKMSFHRKCSREFTERWINEIKDFREWIKSKLPKQR
jgi:hypothetical protein